MPSLYYAAELSLGRFRDGAKRTLCKNVLRRFHLAKPDHFVTPMEPKIRRLGLPHLNALSDHPARYEKQLREREVDLFILLNHGSLSGAEPIAFLRWGASRSRRL